MTSKIILVVTILIVSSVLTGVIFAVSSISRSELLKVWVYNTLYVTFYSLLLLLFNTYIVRKANKDK